MSSMLHRLGGDLLHHRDFRRRWLGASVSIVGSEVTNIALPALAILQLGADALGVAVLIACSRIAFPLLALPAGELIDRWPRRRVMITCDAASAVLVGCVPVAAAMHILSMPLLDVVALFSGVCTVFFDIAALSFTPELLREDQLVEGNAKLQLSHAFGVLVGPGIGGVLVATVGGPNAVGLDALSFIASAALLAGVRSRARPDARIGMGMVEGIREGVGFVTKQPILRSLLIWGAVSTVGYAMAQTVLPLLAYRTFRLSPAVFGIVLSAGGLGGLLGAPVAMRAFAKLGVGRCIAIGWAGPGLVVLAAPLGFLVPAGPSLAVVSFVGGVLLYIAEVGQVSLRQALTPAHLQGRMNATMRSAFWTAWPIGNLLGGIAAGGFGIVAAAMVSGVELVTISLCMLASPVGRVRQISARKED